MKLTPQNLSKAIDLSFAKFAHFRRSRTLMLGQMVGRFYKQTHGASADEGRKASPLNLMYTAVSTLVPNLVFNEPRATVSTGLLAYRQYAELLGLGVDYTIRKIRLRDTLRKVITDAIFLAGFTKTGLAVGDEILKHDGADLSIGRPFVERVDPDDMVLDPLARDWEEQNFVGNRYRVNLDDLQESGVFDAAALENLSNRYDNNQAGAEKLSGDAGNALRDEELGRFVDLVDLWIPSQKIICTLPYEKGKIVDEFLHVADYAGPDRGPYHMLAFTPVPDNILPVPPASIWFDLHTLGNRIARKLARQAERSKRVLAYQGDAADDALKIAEAEDGEGVRVEDVDKLKEVNYGGVTEDSYAWMEWVKRAFSEQAGSIDLLSGQNTNSPTATQATMLQANSSVRLSDMQNTVYNFTSENMEDIAFMLHTDPLIELPLARRAQGQETQVVLTPDSRVGEWFDFNIQTKAYSMARPDPNTAVRRKIEFATNVIPAAAQAAMLMGPGFKVGPFLVKMAEEMGIDDADEFVNDAEMQQFIMARAQVDTGDPGKAGPGAAINPPQMAGINPNPNQPAPTMMGPQGGVSADTEQASAQQEAAGEMQARGGASAKDLALARSNY